MDATKTEMSQDEVEGSAIHFNSGNRIRNKALRRAQVLKDRRQKNKVCVVIGSCSRLRDKICLLFLSDFLCYSILLLYYAPADRGTSG
jgi:hypothetical protein